MGSDFSHSWSKTGHLVVRSKAATKERASEAGDEGQEQVVSRSEVVLSICVLVLDGGMQWRCRLDRKW